MKRNEMIKELMNKAKISREEAEETLINCNWDLLDSIIYLERNGKVENKETTTIIEVANNREEDYRDENNNHKEHCGGVGEVIGRIFKFIGKVIKKGNDNYFEIRKDGEKPIKISLTISVLLLIVGFWLVGILLVAGLFFGYKYSISGPKMNTDKVNDILEKVSESADSIKSEFKDGYTNS